LLQRPVLPPSEETGRARFYHDSSEDLKASSTDTDGNPRYADGSDHIVHRCYDPAMVSATRDYSTISPSARALLLMKSQTSIPFAAEAARLVFGSERLEAELAAMKREPISQLRLQHFESRYRSMDTLLAETGLLHVLELGAGLSFRGLDLLLRPGRPSDFHYLDTDLTEMAALKTELIPALAPAPAVAVEGTLEVLSLDALDPAAFRATVERLGPAPLAVINEGLLVYLDDGEKRRLCANVRDALDAHGGVWITGDIYVRTPPGDPTPVVSPRTRAFLEQHRVEENKFVSWDAAERLFTDEGFTIRRRLGSPGEPRSIRESWVLARR
jgi:hypothetical protein